MAQPTPESPLNTAAALTQRWTQTEVHLPGMTDQFHVDNGTFGPQAETRYVLENAANADPGEVESRGHTSKTRRPNQTSGGIQLRLQSVQ